MDLLKNILFLVILLIVNPLFSHGITETPSEVKVNLLDDKVVTIGTGSKKGIYYPFGENLCRLIYRNTKQIDLKCKVLETLGSRDNLVMLKNGKIDFALSQSDWLDPDLYNSTEIKTDLENPNLRFIMSLYDEDIAVVVRRGSNFKSLDDLKGKAISSNSRNNQSNLSLSLQALFKSKSWSSQDLRGVTDIRIDDQANALCNQEIDAFIIISGTPSDIILDAAQTCEIDILTLDNASITNNLNQATLSLHPSTIMAGIYPGINKPVQTLAIKSALVTNATVSDDIVYNITKLIIENLESFKKINTAFISLDPLKMATAARPIPLHPGSARYFKEKGWSAN